MRVYEIGEQELPPCRAHDGGTQACGAAVFLLNGKGGTAARCQTLFYQKELIQSPTAAARHRTQAQSPDAGGTEHLERENWIPWGPTNTPREGPLQAPLSGQLCCVPA